MYSIIKTGTKNKTVYSILLSMKKSSKKKYFSWVLKNKYKADDKVKIANNRYSLSMDLVMKIKAK